MASEPTIDIDALLHPIEGENPAGSDIREDVSPGSLYYQLKDARSAARAAERAGDPDDDSQSLLPEWRLVLDLGPQALAEHTKDLEVAAWLIEALLRAHGFAGLRDGFKLARGLVENFWDGLYPLPDEDGIETCVAPFSGLNGEGGDGTLIMPIRMIPLSEGDPPFASWQYEQALEVQQITDEEKRQRRLDEGAMTLDQIEGSLNGCRPQFFAELLADCDAAIEAFAELSAAFDAAAGQDAPPTSTIRNRLTAVRGIIVTLTEGRMPVEEAADEDAGTETQEADVGGQAAMAAGTAAPAGKITNRDQAFDALRKVADYFRTYEPQAPTAFVIDELVRRGRLSFADLMAELVEDPEARKRMLIAAGMKPPEPQDGYYE